MNEPIIPKGIDYCVQGNCPKAQQCVRHILYLNNTQALPCITVLNPLLNPFDTDGCPHFGEYKTARYACGFCNIYNALPVRSAMQFRKRIPGITSESMYYRMKRGDYLIPPSLQKEILDAAHQLGAPQSVDFDRYCDVVEV